jgi:hypothetical protein
MVVPAELLSIELRIAAVRGEQLLVAAALDDDAMVEDEGPVDPARNRS